MNRELELATRAVDRATDALTGAEVAVAVDRHRSGLTRFANSVIHQNVAEDVTTVRIRIHLGGRTSVTSRTVVTDSDLDELLSSAAEAVQIAPPDAGWPGLAPAAAIPAPTRVAASETSPADRAAAVRAFVDAAGGLEAAGYCRTNSWSGSFVNSAGQSVSADASECGMSGVVRDAGRDGAARHAPLTMSELDGARLGARAAAKARAWVDPVELPAGRYEVVLEPAAVADVVETIAAVGFNGKLVHQQRSFVRLGDDQFDPSITFVDDPLAVGQTYDDEGTPRSRLVLVDAGGVRSVTQDRRSAAEAGATSTGHAFDGVFTWGPYARHLGLSAGQDGSAPPAEADGPVADSSVADLVAGVERGVLVSDLWYTRVLDTRTLAITGLTRNGTFLIEHGQVTRALRNFRFTQSYAQALMPGNVLGVGSWATEIPGDTYSPTSPRWSCPALRLASWNFTGGASG